MSIFPPTNSPTFMDVLEQLLEQMWGVSSLKVQMALEFLQQQQEMWNHPFITSIAPPIMWPTFYINTGSQLQWVQVMKMACPMVILIYTLTIFRWRLVGGGACGAWNSGLKQHHKDWRDFYWGDHINISSCNTVLAVFDENVSMGEALGLFLKFNGMYTIQ